MEADEANRYRFAHALMQHALDGELSAARRQRTHLRVAEALEAEDRAVRQEDVVRLSELARHWQAATRPTDVSKAIPPTAGVLPTWPMEALAPADAARLYGQGPRAHWTGRPHSTRVTAFGCSWPWAARKSPGNMLEGRQTR